MRVGSPAASDIKKTWDLFEHLGNNV